MSGKQAPKEPIYLDAYLEKHGISQKDFAKRIGVSKNTISNYICCTRKPSLGIAMRIQEETGGEVTIKKLLEYWETHASYTHKEEDDTCSYQKLR